MSPDERNGAGRLEGLQTASIIAAAPFALIMLLICASLFRALQDEGRASRWAERERRRRVDELLAREWRETTTEPP